MDAFQIIQHFFTRMHCQECSQCFAKEDVELLRREEALYIVNVYCHKCEAPNGVALVGVDVGNLDALDEHDLEHAEFDMELPDDEFSSDNADDIFIPVGRDFKSQARSMRAGRMAIPEEVLMQLLSQAGEVLGNKTRKKSRFKDPELTEAERERLSQYAPVSPDDVLDAHHFIQDLGGDWMKFIPDEMRQSQTELHTESQTG